jgi:hypothetical protein
MSFSPTPDEIAERYMDARARVLDLIPTIADEQYALSVPGTPKWTVHDLLSHIVGCPIELAAGHFDGAGGEEWTQAQVEARSDVSVADLVTEWIAAGPSIDAAIRGGSVPVPIALDIITHEQDLRGAIAAPRTPDQTAVRFLSDGFGSRLAHVVEKADLPPVEIRAEDTDYVSGAPGGVTASATEYEWFRAMPGRRSSAQVAAFTWSADPAPYLALLSPFGPLPEVDVVD